MTRIKADQIRASAYKPEIFEIKYEDLYFEAQEINRNEWRILYNNDILRMNRDDNNKRWKIEGTNMAVARLIELVFNEFYYSRWD